MVRNLNYAGIVDLRKIVPRSATSHLRRDGARIRVTPGPTSISRTILPSTIIVLSSAMALHTAIIIGN